ncbi:MAG: hypothetical protein K2G44_06750 [Clostridia bacterium]|nr:hypothetical protein [Clostridia bacterium]
MVKAVLGRVGTVLLAALLVAAVALSLFSSFPKNASADEEKYLCTWQNGSVTEETYATAYGDFLSDEDGTLRLLRGDLYGEISATEKYLSVVQTLEEGGLEELLALSIEGVTRLELLALWRLTRGRVWYSAGYFVWDGNGLKEVGSAEGEHLILLSGSISASRLRAAGAKQLELRSEAQITSQTLTGTSVESVTAYPPYFTDGGVIYLDTGTAVRLVAALPNSTSLTVNGNDYADEGALLAAEKLETLTLPFAGNAPVYGNYFHGEVAYLFSNGREYFVPPTLKRVRITGGLLISHAFYRMNAVEEIDLCGMDARVIAPDALADCTAWKRVHSPNANVQLSGRFSSYVAPCGCTVFERIA